MIAQKFQLREKTTHVVEPIIKDENIHYMHMVLLPGEALPTHVTNATVYMTVVTGTLTIRLAQEQPQQVIERTILKIPFGTEMDAQNYSTEILELIVVKAPAPQNNK